MNNELIHGIEKILSAHVYLYMFKLSDEFYIKYLSQSVLVNVKGVSCSNILLCGLAGFFKGSLNIFPIRKQYR